MSNINTFNLYLLSLKKSFQDRLREKKFKSSNYNVSLGGIQPHRIYESSNIQHLQIILMRLQRKTLLGKLREMMDFLIIQEAMTIGQGTLLLVQMQNLISEKLLQIFMLHLNLWL